MRNTRPILAALAAAGLTATLAMPLAAQPGWGPPRLEGRGVWLLAPPLRETPDGRAFVMRNFDLDHDGLISPHEARAANRAFAQLPRSEGRGIDWQDRAGPPPRMAPERGGWDHDAMRAYHFRETPEGARMTMQEDVLFRTDSAELRPGAVDRLRPLAGFLRDTPGVRVAIDGYTDSRGSRAHNQDLSERRAQSVANALSDMGVDQPRLRLRGHGEDDPTATNDTLEGMRLNRRVEVTLLGRRAREFE